VVILSRIIISPLAGSSGLAMPEASARFVMADESMIESTAAATVPKRLSQNDAEAASAAATVGAASRRHDLLLVSAYYLLGVRSTP
jgi:hypothetical protein